jgi:hypothetical protein
MIMIGILVVACHCGQGGDRVVTVDAQRSAGVLAVHDGFTDLLVEVEPAATAAG